MTGRPKPNLTPLRAQVLWMLPCQYRDLPGATEIKAVADMAKLGWVIYDRSNGTARMRILVTEAGRAARDASPHPVPSSPAG